MMNLFENKKKY